MMKLLLFLSALLICSGLRAQALRTPVSSSHWLLNAYSPELTDAFSFTLNTAALARRTDFSAGAFAENRFGMKEINHFSAAASMATNHGNFGIQTDYFGHSKFNEYQLGLAYGRSLGSLIDIGAQFNYYAYRIPAYNQQSTVTFQLGMIGRLSDVVSVGIQIYNPAGGYLSKKDNEKLSSHYQFGVGYEPSENVILSATLGKEEGRNISATAGIFYQFAEKFFARAGIRTEGNMPFGAAGIFFSDIHIDISVSHHSQLGFSPGVMLIYQPAKNR